MLNASFVELAHRQSDIELLRLVVVNPHTHKTDLMLAKRRLETLLPSPKRDPRRVRLRLSREERGWLHDVARRLAIPIRLGETPKALQNLPLRPPGQR